THSSKDRPSPARIARTARAAQAGRSRVASTTEMRGAGSSTAARSAGGAGRDDRAGRLGDRHRLLAGGGGRGGERDAQRFAPVIERALEGRSGAKRIHEVLPLAAVGVAVVAEASHAR